MLWVHVRTGQETLQGRQGTPLLERGGERSQPRRAGRSASGAVPGRDQRSSARGVVPFDRGVAGRFRVRIDGAVRRRRRGAGAGLRGGADPGQGAEFTPTAAVGRVLAGADVVGSAGAGSILAYPAAVEPSGHTLAGRVEDVGVLSADRSGQRMAVASALVRSQRDARLAGQSDGGHRQRYAVPLSGQAGGAQAGVFLGFAGALGDVVRRAASTSCCTT